MFFLVIDKDFVNTIFTDDAVDIGMIEFKTKEDAEHYLRYGTQKKIDQSDTIKVFTDGSCSMNGSIYARAGIGVYFGEEDPRNVSKKIGGKQTNNTAELSAVIEVFRILKDEIKEGTSIIIYTDSEYVVKCCTSFGVKCEKDNWTKKKGKIPNVELVKEVYSLYKQYENVQIEWIRAHTNNNDELSKGNEGADLLANMSIGGKGGESPLKKLYLNVPFAKKDLAKKNGARWDKDKKKWYYTEDLDTEKKATLVQAFG